MTTLSSQNNQVLSALKRKVDELKKELANAEKALSVFTDSNMGSEQNRHIKRKDLPVVSKKDWSHLGSLDLQGSFDKMNIRDIAHG